MKTLVAALTWTLLASSVVSAQQYNYLKVEFTNASDKKVTFEMRSRKPGKNPATGKEYNWSEWSQKYSIEPEKQHFVTWEIKKVGNAREVQIRFDNRLKGTFTHPVEVKKVEKRDDEGKQYHFEIDDKGRMGMYNDN